MIMFVWPVCLFSLLLVSPHSAQDQDKDQCQGVMGKAMKRLRCGEQVLQEDKQYEERRKEFVVKAPGDMVQEHYADLPYPPFSLSDIAREMSYYAGRNNDRPLVQQYSNNLDMISHHLYRGNQSYEPTFRVLIAGGGTGSSASYMGEQLRNTGGQVYYLDFSPASLAIAQQRAEIRSLDNVQFILGSIENIPHMGLGLFDYIESTGVLHHLTSSELGLQVLADSLKDGGGGNLMLYARYGRTGVYQMQALVRMVNEEMYDRDAELSNLYHLVRSMGSGVFTRDSLLRRLDFGIDNSSTFYNRILNPEIQALGSQDEVDGEAYDRFCHKQDRAFSIPELYDFLESAGLTFVSLTRPREQRKFDIESLNLDEIQKKAILLLNKRDQHAIAELMHGSVNGHSFFYSKQTDTIAEPTEELVPYLFGNPVGLQEKLDKAELDKVFKATCSVERAVIELEFLLTKNMQEIFRYLFKDNNLTLGEIFTQISETHGEEVEEVKKDFNLLYRSTAQHGLVLLSSKTAKRRNTGELQLFYCS